MSFKVPSRERPDQQAAEDPLGAISADRAGLRGRTFAPLSPGPVAPGFHTRYVLG
jgi:hypothetical protein